MRSACIWFGAFPFRKFHKVLTNNNKLNDSLKFVTKKFFVQSPDT